MKFLDLETCHVPAQFHIPDTQTPIPIERVSHLKVKNNEAQSE